MKSKKGKLFRNRDSKCLVIEYKPDDGYYSFVQKEQRNGNSQIIITSGIMLALAETLLTKYAFNITGIEFMVDGSDFEDEISMLLGALQDNKAYWAVLKDRLQFLQREDSVEIKRISFKSALTGEMHDVYVNGVFVSAEAAYESFSTLLSGCIARCLE